MCTFDEPDLAFTGGVFELNQAHGGPPESSGMAPLRYGACEITR
jgi:hypothetical protein